MDLYFNTSTNKLVMNEGDLVVVRDRLDELVQRLYISFKTFKREWFWNEEYGIDYINDVFGAGRLKFTVDTVMQQIILDEYLVLSLDYFASEIKDYNYSCTFRVKMIDERVSENIYLLTNENGLYLTTASGKKLATKF